MNKFIELHNLYKKAGIGERPITDDELKELQIILKELGDYMEWRGDRTMALSFRVECESVNSLIINRSIEDQQMRWDKLMALSFPHNKKPS